MKYLLIVIQRQQQCKNTQNERSDLNSQVFQKSKKNNFAATDKGSARQCLYQQIRLWVTLVWNLGNFYIFWFASFPWEHFRYISFQVFKTQKVGNSRCHVAAPGKGSPRNACISATCNAYISATWLPESQSGKQYGLGGSLWLGLSLQKSRPSGASARSVRLTSAQFSGAYPSLLFEQVKPTKKTVLTVKKPVLKVVRLGRTSSIYNKQNVSHIHNIVHYFICLFLKFVFLHYLPWFALMM